MFRPLKSIQAELGAVPATRSVVSTRRVESDGRTAGTEMVGGDFYVANTDAVVKFPYEPGQSRITARGTTVRCRPPGG